MTISEDEVAAAYIETSGAVTDRFAREREDKHGLCMFLETRAFRARTKDDKYEPQWRYAEKIDKGVSDKGVAAKKAFAEACAAGPYSVEDATRDGLLVEDKDIRSMFYDDNMVYLPFKIDMVPSFFDSVFLLFLCLDRCQHRTRMATLHPRPSFHSASAACSAMP
jgi:hypothetical protein